MNRSFVRFLGSNTNLSKMPFVCAPPTPFIGVEIVELQGAESVESPTLTGPPHEEALTR